MGWNQDKKKNSSYSGNLLLTDRDVARDWIIPRFTAWHAWKWVRLFFVVMVTTFERPGALKNAPSLYFLYFFSSFILFFFIWAPTRLTNFDVTISLSFTDIFLIYSTDPCHPSLKDR